GRRAKGGRVEVGIAQTSSGDAVQRGCRDDATESGWRSEANIIGHDEENVRCALRRYHACGPIRLGLRGIEIDFALEWLSDGRQIVTINRGSGVWRARNA